MEGLRGDKLTFDEAQQAFADKIAEDYDRKVEMVRLAARIKELELELAQINNLITVAFKNRVEALGTDAKNAVDTLPGDPTDLDKLIWLGKNEYMFRAIAFSRPKT